MISLEVGDGDVGGRYLLVYLALLRANHDQSQLPCRLTALLFLDNIFGIFGTVFGTLIVQNLGCSTLYI